MSEDNNIQPKEILPNSQDSLGIRIVKDENGKISLINSNKSPHEEPLDFDINKEDDILSPIQVKDYEKLMPALDLKDQDDLFSSVTSKDTGYREPHFSEPKKPQEDVKDIVNIESGFPLADKPEKNELLVLKGNAENKSTTPSEPDKEIKEANKVKLTLISIDSSQKEHTDNELLHILDSNNNKDANVKSVNLTLVANKDTDPKQDPKQDPKANTDIEKTPQPALTKEEIKKKKLAEEKAKEEQLRLEKQLKEKKENIKRTVFILLNIIMLFLFVVTLAVVLLWPEYLPKMHFTVQKSLVVLMIEISILLFLGALQHTFSKSFRVTALFGSIIVAVESVIMVILGGN